MKPGTRDVLFYGTPSLALNGFSCGCTITLSWPCPTIQRSAQILHSQD